MLIFIFLTQNNQVSRSFARSFNKYRMRALCPVCRQHPVAINYYRKQQVHYRTMCTPCIHARRKPAKPIPGWVKAGYKKKEKCDRCSFKFKLVEQSNVFYVDGNLSNNHWANLKTVCLNCQQEIANTKWRPSAIQPDF